MTDHDELRALAAKATTGPWRPAQGARGYGVACPHGTIIAETTGWGVEDAAYIAAVSPDVVVGLLDEIAELRAAHAQAVDELRLWGAATVTQSDTGHGRARLGGAA